MPSTPLIDYLKVQKATDQSILRALQASNVTIDRELKNLAARTGVGAAVRREQLLLTQARINQEMARLWQAVGDITKAQKAVAAGAAAEAILKDSTALSSLFSAADRDYMARSAAATASRGLEAVERRLEGSSYVPLAESVYNNNALSSGKVDDIVNAALARGASALELAKDVKAYINPNTPGGVRYASLRLARSEINNSFHASQVKQAQESPWVTAVKWNLSGSHPVPDECNEYAEKSHFEDGDPGLWKPTEVPGKPHPNCLCYTTMVDVDRDEFIRQFEAGAYDKYLEENFPDLPPSNPPSNTIPRAPTPLKPEAAYPPLSGVRYADGVVDAQSYVTEEFLTTSVYSAAEQEAMRKYVTPKTFHTLRDKAYAGETDVVLDALDSALIKGSTAEDGVLWRTMMVDEEWSSSLSEGSVIQPRWHMSTSVLEGAAKPYGAPKGMPIEVTMKMLVPKGTPIFPGETGLREWVLGKKSKLSVRRIERDGNKMTVVVDVS